MQESTNTVTDVEFKEVEEKAVELFNPVTYLIDALTRAGHPDPLAWTKDLDPRAQTADKEEERIFFVNRAVRLYMSEHTDQENITPRMLLAEGISAAKWIALAEQGIVKWLTGELTKRFEGKKENLGEVQDFEAIPSEVHEQGLNPHTTVESVSKFYEAGKNLTEQQKAELNDFYSNNKSGSLVINDLTFTFTNDGESAAKVAFFTDKPDVTFPVPRGAFLPNVTITE